MCDLSQIAFSWSLAVSLSCCPVVYIYRYAMEHAQEKPLLLARAFRVINCDALMFWTHRPSEFHLHLISYHISIFWWYDNVSKKEREKWVSCMGMKLFDTIINSLWVMKLNVYETIEGNSTLIGSVLFMFHFILHGMTVMEITPWNSQLRLALVTTISKTFCST
jgi:hypothetical protein